VEGIFMDENNQCSCINFLANNDTLKLSVETETYKVYGNLNKGEKIILKYFGKLITEDSSNVTKIFLNYGYGNLWDEKNVIEMKLCCHNDIKCYCTSIELINSENLFFCFMDCNNNWDINNNSSYMLAIDTPVTMITKKTVAVTILEEEHLSKTNKLFKIITNKLISIFAKIGGLFDNKVKV
jgi:hypothetical protein